MNTAVPTASHPNPGMQVTTFENPMGIDGFEFVEFAAPAGRGQELHEYFRKMGFSAGLKHKQRPITVYRQGDVNFLVNEDPDSFAADFAELIMSSEWTAIPLTVIIVPINNEIIVCNSEVLIKFLLNFPWLNYLM